MILFIAIYSIEYVNRDIFINSYYKNKDLYNFFERRDKLLLKDSIFKMDCRRLFKRDNSLFIEDNETINLHKKYIRNKCIGFVFSKKIAKLDTFDIK